MPRKRTERSSNQPIMCVGVYYLTVGMFIIGMIAPEGRVWGFNWWGYWPAVWRYLLVSIALAGGPLVWYLATRLQRHDGREEYESSHPGYYYVAAPVVVLSTLLFALFPSATHFLGDGYQLLTRLADGLGSVKSWDIGATWVNDVVFRMTSGGDQERALTTYRIISVASGILTLVIVAVAARLLFAGNARRLLFLIGVGSGGYTLMFFGYVENYALLIAMLMLYCLLGLLALRGRISSWWALPVMAAASFIHIFGLTLLPGLLYLLLRGSRPAERLAELPGKTKLIFALVLLVLGLVVYHYLNVTHRFFTFAFLPILPDQFTVEGDYLLSLKHILDTINLLLLLVPGLLVLAVGILFTSGRAIFDSSQSRFLLIVTLSTLAAVYVFNPGIGMPRNWDLFAIVGVPLAVLCYRALLSARSGGRLVVTASSLACLLSLSVLAPRVVSQATPEIAIAHFRNYLELDKIRNRNARRLLIDYYKQTGDNNAAAREQRLAERDYPESGYNKQGRRHLSNGDFDKAEADFHTAIELNPLFYDAYANLANCRIARGELDSALTLLEIADGLNPYNASTIGNIGTVYLRMNEPDKAIQSFKEALRIDSLNQNSLVGLASAYLKTGQPARSIEYVTRLFEKSGLSYHYFQQAAEAYLEAGHIEEARQAFEYARRSGLSATEVEAMAKRYPQLRE